MAREKSLIQPQSTETAVFAQQAEITYSVHSGPLPPPEDLAKYNMVLPDAAERIFRMAELQQAHRMELEKQVVGSDVQRSKWGQVLAAGVTGMCLLTGYGFARLGHPVEGAGVITTNIIGLATVFIVGRAMQKKEREEKAKVQAGQPSPKELPKLKKETPNLND